MAKSTPIPSETYVARWHSDEGHFTVLVTRDAKGLRALVQGHPCVLVKLSPREELNLARLDYPVKKAARAMRRFARKNATGRARAYLDGVLAG
jgi:hypothetical protein